MKILVATTMTNFAVRNKDDRFSMSWLDTVLEEPAGATVDYFATLEIPICPGNSVHHYTEVTDTKEEFDKVTDVLDSMGGAWWWFSIDDGRESVSSANRLHHICAGRNLIQDYAVGKGYDKILFLDADTAPPADALTKLLEMGWPLAGGHVPTYNLSGPLVPTYPPEWGVRAHMNTAGFLLVDRAVFRQIRWRVDPDMGWTDDPCYREDAKRFLGVETHVRHDCVAQHWPPSIPALEGRGHNLSVS